MQMRSPRRRAGLLPPQLAQAIDVELSLGGTVDELQVVPLPGAALVLATGVAGLAAVRRRPA